MPSSRPLVEVDISQSFFHANAVEYGVPQRRHRLFVLGSRHGVPVPPVPTHAAPDVAEARGLRPFETAGPALKAVSTRERLAAQRALGRGVGALSQWNGPVHGPGLALIVHDGSSGLSLSRKFQNLVSVTNVGLGCPPHSVCAL